MKKIPHIDWDRIFAITQRLDFFNKFSMHDQRKIIGLHANLITYEKGEFLIKDGESDTSFYLLLSGSVSVSKEGKPPFAQLKAGEFFGEIAFLTGAKRTADVVADETSIVMKIDRDSLSRLDVDIREKFKDKVLDKLIRRLDNMNNAFVNRWS